MLGMQEICQCFGWVDVFVATFEIGVLLGSGEFVGFGRLFDFKPCAMPQIVGAAERVGIEAYAVADLSCFGTSKTQVNDNGVVGLAGDDPNRCFDRSSLEGQFDHVGCNNAQRFGGCRTHLCRVVPDEFGDWFGHFLEPTIIGCRAVSEG